MNAANDDDWRTLAELEAVFCRGPEGLLPGDFRNQLGEAVAGNRISFKRGDEREWFFRDWALAVGAIEQNAYTAARAARSAEGRNIPRYNPLRTGERASSSTSPSPRKPQPPTWERLFEDPSLHLLEWQIRQLLNGPVDAKPEGGTEAVGSSDRSEGGRPRSWDWQRASLKAFNHFVENGFSPSDANAGMAIAQIAGWMADWLTDNAGGGGEKARASDAKQHAVAVYGSIRRELDDAPSRLK